jgi:hypothetical protein
MPEPLLPTEPQLRLICHTCGQRFWQPADQERVCPECGGYLRHFGPLEGLVDRFVAPGDQVDSQLYKRHLQMIEALWTRDGKGREYYEILRPKLSYSRFEKEVTELVCRGLREGWAELRLPRAPVPSDDAYSLELDVERFVAEMTALFDGRRP